MDLCNGLAAASGSPLPVFCVVKEVEAPPEDAVPEEKMLGVAEFEDKYFCGPLYHDPERAFWTALGNEPIFTLGTLGKALINPFKARREMKEMGERMKEKGVEGNMVGDGLAKGGVLVIAPDSSVRHVFREDPGNGTSARLRSATVERRDLTHSRFDRAWQASPTLRSPPFSAPPKASHRTPVSPNRRAAAAAPRPELTPRTAFV